MTDLHKLDSVYQLAANHLNADGERCHPTTHHLIDMTVAAGIADRDTAFQLIQTLHTTGRLAAYDVAGLATFLCPPGQQPDPADIADEDGWITCTTRDDHG